MRRVLVLCTIICCLSTMANAAEPASDLPVLKTKVKTLAAFKNGLGFVFRAGETNLKGGWAIIDELPPASLGTLWIGASPPLRVDEVVATKGTLQREVDAVNLGEMLKANVGRNAKLTVATSGSEQPSVIEGVIVSVPGDRTPEPINPGFRDTGSNQGQIVILQTADGGVVALNKTAIRSIQLPSGSGLKTSVSREVNTAKIRVRSETNNDLDVLLSLRAEISMAYLEKGITWSPGYLVNIASEKEAEITLEAVFGNDIEDLEDADVSFVVGYPNFMYADFTSLLDTRQSVAAFVQALVSGPNTDRSAGRYGSVTQQSMAWSNVAAYESDARWRPETAYSAGNSMPGESNEDLYFYKRDHVTLKKGDRARYTVFTAKVPYKHIYEWEVPDTDNLDYSGYRRDSGDKKDQPDEVWHALKIENTTSQPWTTAPALAVNGSMPVAQDMLKYTPPKGKSTLKLTIATDIRAEQSQTEASRELVKIGYNDYDSVVVDGTLTIRNLKSTGVSMDVKKHLTGEVLESGQSSKAVKVAKRVTAVNPQSQVEWEFDIPAGGEKELTYKYKILVRR